MVNECIDDVSEDEGPRSPQAVLHLSEQQADQQVIHEEDAMALVAVRRLRCSGADRQQNPLDGDLQHRGKEGQGKHAYLKSTQETKLGTEDQSLGEYVIIKHVTGVLERMATRDLWVALWHLLR